MINNWTPGVDYPEWMTEESLKTLSRQHLLKGESPREMYERLATTLGARLRTMPVKNGAAVDYNYIEEKWMDYMWKGWLCPSTPILSNVGTKRGFGISCFIERVPDSMDGIYGKVHEMAMLTKMGGGVGVGFDKVRGRGEAISVGGFSEGIVPFAKVYDSAIIAASQGNVRRGSASINLPIRHRDANEFLDIRRPIGDVNRQCLNINHCVSIDDYFYEDVMRQEPNALELWAKVLSTRMKTGQPYILNYHNVQKGRPYDMVKRNLKIDATNICTEIMLPSDFDHTVVCDVASLNLSKYDEWKNDKELIELSLLFLDANLEEFIVSAEGYPGFENAIRFAKKSRALGLGVLGWHTYLQRNMIPFISLTSRALIKQVGTKLQNEGVAYNKKWGEILGNPEWCDFLRNLTLFAFAPTATNSIVAGGVAAEIEPRVGNAWIHKTAKGTFIRRNPEFEAYMKTNHPDMNTEEFWDDLFSDKKGSVQSYKFLSDEAKEVFLTAYEINQLDLVKFAAIWQTFVDQGISLNLFFPKDVDPKWFNKVHLTAWEEGIKSLYYVRTESALSREMTNNTFSDCSFCEG